MAQFTRVAFSEQRTGSCASLSPNSCFIAHVDRGTNVHIDEVTSLFFEADAAGQHTERRLGTYVALDEVTDLLWSPDSSMVAVWMAPRATIEVVSVASLASVARVDGGLNGMRRVAWHPSSRCIYWFGTAKSYAVSLIDGGTMAFTDPVKVVGPTGFAAWAMRDRSLFVAAAVDAGRAKQAISLRQHNALLATSSDAAYIFTVSPRNTDDEADGTAAPRTTEPEMTAGDFAAMIGREVARIDSAAIDENVRVTPETFNVFDAATHEKLASFPIDLSFNAPEGTAHAPRQVGSVTAFFVTTSCVALYDQPNSHVVLTSLDGARRLGEFSDIVALDASPDGNTLFLLDAKAELLITVTSIYQRTHRLGDLPLRPSYLRADTPVLTEHSIERADEFGADGGATAGKPAAAPPRASYQLADGDVDLVSFDSFTADAIARRGTDSIFAVAYNAVIKRREQEPEPSIPRIDPAIAVSAASAAVRCSPCGKFVAVVSPRLPTCAFIVEVASSSVASVLRHEAPVAAIQWRPGSDPALALTTDSRAGNVYLWTPACAMCVSVPLPPVRAAPPKRASARSAEATEEAVGAVTRVAWGASGAALLLVDDLAERFCSARLTTA